jgi:hypothetical protein
MVAFLSDAHTLLGPAITDAADWEDETDWAGIVLSPSAGDLIDQADSYLEDELRLRHYLASGFPPPFKATVYKECTRLPKYSIAWPLEFLFDENGYCATARSEVERLIAPPVGAKPEVILKCQQTLEFFNHCEAHYRSLWEKSGISATQ